MTKEQIDNMSYESMFKLWRSAPIGDSTFQGEIGEYFTKIFQEKKAALKPGEYTTIMINSRKVQDGKERGNC